MAKRNTAPSPEAGHEATAHVRLRRQVRALRTGVTVTALLGGLACYIFLAQWGVAPLIAGIIGLVFALLGRVALASLAVDFVLRSATRNADRPPPSPSPHGNPGPPGERPPQRGKAP